MEIGESVKASTSSSNKPISRKRRPAIFFISAFSVLLLILALFMLGTVLNYSTIYKGVNIDGADVGGMTREELNVFLQEHYAHVFSNTELTVSCERFENHVALSELGIRINIGAMAQKAYETGRTGNLIERLSKIILLPAKPVSIGLIIDYETKDFNDFLDRICKSVYQGVIPSNMIIEEEKVTLLTGIPGQEADRDRLKQDIKWAVEGAGPKNITVSVLKKLPAPLDIETALKVLNQPPVNAEFVKTSRTTYEIKPDQMGRRIERSQLMDVINYINNRENQEYEEMMLPVEFISPDITQEELKEKIFKDTLASYTTNFKTDTENNMNRSINIGLASESIDGTILLPGEEFSFNKVVGARTVQKGYKTAHIYVAGEIRDGTGGGICQVSTTLYNAVLRANLPVSERHNHMFTVGYVPLGTDAAVSYGYADLVFKNTTAYPVIIYAKVTGNQLNIRIKATNEYPGLKVKIATKTLKKVAATEQIFDDPSLPQGTVRIADKGMDGYEVETYLKVFMNDVLLREEKLHKSVYKMMPRKIIRGTASVMDRIEQ